MFSQFQVGPKAKYEAEDRLYSEPVVNTAERTQAVSDVRKTSTGIAPYPGVTLKTTKLSRDIDH